MMPYLVTRRRLAALHVASRSTALSDFARALDRAGDQVPPCRHGADPSRPCPGCAERSTWHAAARLARSEAARDA